MNVDVFIGFLIGIAVGCVMLIAVTRKTPEYHALQIIQGISSGEEAKFRYLTDEFYFESDSLYVVGDVLKIGK